MKFKFIYNLFFLALFVFVLQSRSGGVANIMSQDRTGSPVAVQGTYCAACHSGGQFNTDIEINIMKNGAMATTYLADSVYQVEFKVLNGSGSPNGFGIQAAILDAANGQAGEFMNPSSGAQITDLGAREYFEHASRSSSNTFTVDWKAPSSGTGDVTFYAGGVAVNANGATSGDEAAKNSSTLTEEISSKAFDIDRDDLKLSILGNPVSSILNFEMTGKVEGDRLVQIIDVRGKNVFSQSYNSLTGISEQVNIAGFDPGIYYLIVRNNKSVARAKFLKI